MAIRIDRALLEEVLARAAASPGEEVCGLLFGSDAAIDAARPTANVAPAPARAFEVEPGALLAALRAERGGGPRLIGHYHSHPGGLPIPSPCDLAASVAGQLWLIVGGSEARAWRATGHGFDEVSLSAA